MEFGMTKESPQEFARKLFYAFIGVMIGIVILTITDNSEYMFILGMVAPYLTINHVIKNQDENHPMPLTWKRLFFLVINPTKTLDEVNEAIMLKARKDKEAEIAKTKLEAVSIVKK